LTVSASSAGIFSSIAGKKTRQTRGYVDQVAAQIILQNYLDSRAQQKQQEALSRASIEGFGAGCVEWQPASRKLNRPCSNRMAALPGMVGGRNNGKSDFRVIVCARAEMRTV